jgi:hypothetical protein
MAGNKLGLDGTVALSAKLSTCCKLIHLNIGGNDIGDMGLKFLLNGIISSGGHVHLLRLDLHDNGLTLATPSFTALAKFVHLRYIALTQPFIPSNVLAAYLTMYSRS